MKISIVTISYNQAPFLRQCIDSVLSQQDANVEYIVVDPGSTDGSRAIVESYGDQIVKVFEPDAGPADGLNNGFARATGDIFGFVNADDFLLPNALSNVLKYFREDASEFFLTGTGYIEHVNGARKKVFPSRLSASRYLYGACTVFQQGTFFPARIFRSAGGFNAHNETCWDGELFLTFLNAGCKHRVVREELAVFRIHNGSISGSGRLAEQYQKDKQRMFEKTFNRHPQPQDRLLGVFMGLWVKAEKLKSLLAG